MNPDTPEPDGYGLVMPFTVVKSADGPYDDEAFCAGYDCAKLWDELETCARFGATPQARHVKSGIIPQLDLIAMNHGFTVAFDDESAESHGWRLATFARSDGPVQP